MKKSYLIILLLLLIGGLFLVIFLPTISTIIPKIFHLIQAEDYQGLAIYLRSFGVLGASILFILQFLQSLLPVFPVVILQLVAGILYGPYLGTLIVVIANALANILVFTILHRLDKNRLDQLFRFRWLRNFRHYFQSKNATTVVFFFYLLPLSNGFIPYLAATTKITYRNFIFALLLATTPMTFLTVYLGDSIFRGQWLRSAIIFVLIVGATIGLYFLKNPILRFLRSGKKLFQSRT